MIQFTLTFGYTLGFHSAGLMLLVFKFTLLKKISFIDEVIIRINTQLKKIMQKFQNLPFTPNQFPINLPILTLTGINTISS
jgi:hypothetical protein